MEPHSINTSFISTANGAENAVIDFAKENNLYDVK